MVLFIGGCTALVAGVSSEVENEKSESLSDIQDAQTDKPKGKPSKSSEPTKSAKPEREFTVAQENAILSALSYLENSSFARSELIGQLEFEDYKTKTAQFAVRAIEKAGEVNWKKEAVESATSYLENGSWSKAELEGQLEFEGFTPEQARHGVNVAYK